MMFPQRWLATRSGGISGKAKVVWNRIAVSRLTILYFGFSIVYFIIQLSLQIRAFTTNASAASFLEHIVVQGNATTTDVPFQHNSTISLCNWVESDLNTDVESCRVVWSGDNLGSQERLQDNSGQFPGSLSTVLSAPPTTSSLTPTSTSSTISASTTTVFVIASPSSSARPTSVVDDEDEDDDDDEDVEEGLSSIGRITITNLGKRDHPIFALNDEPLSTTCLESLNWPLSQLRNTKREDIVFMGFQFWVLGMSFIALLNESIPHILASLLTHVMVTAWAAHQITQTANFRSTFNRIITNGACNGAVILPDFWKARANAEYPALALHAVALLVSCFLTWKLVKLYGWQTFKRVGASLTINRLYKIVLILSITIQLSLFFMITTVCLWLDQLFNSVIGDLADFTKLYKASSFITLALLVPWLMMGWFAVRRELRLPMFFFLVLSILYLAGWGVMFFSTTFRWTFVTWRFFAVMASASVFLTCLSFIFGVICRFNFGRGLLRYLKPQDSVIEDDDRSSVWDEKKDIENVPFPSKDPLVPTFSASHGPDDVYVVGATYSQGPRFFKLHAEPFERTSPSPVSVPLPAITRNLTDIPKMTRSGSNGSERSHASIVSSFHSRGSDHIRQDSHSSSQSGSKRWVIE